MLLCGIIQTLEENHKRTNTAWIPIYFFCQATKPDFNTAESVMQSLLAFLFAEFPDLRQKHLDPQNTYRPEWLVLVQNIKNVLQDLGHQGVYLIVDALDECVHGLQKLLKAIVELSRLSLNIKVLISSRDLPQMRRGLGNLTQKIELSLEGHQSSISSAVESYIAHQVSALAGAGEYSTADIQTIDEYLTKNAGGTFLWVALVCKKLTDMDTCVDDVYGLLEANFPPGLEQLYTSMMKSIKNSSRYPYLCEQILAIACVVYRPLSWAEMTSLLESPTKNDATTAIRSCGSFLTTDEHGAMISFVHLSAKDFLLGNSDASKRILPGGLPRQHYLLFERSLGNLMETLKYDMYDLGHIGSLMEHISTTESDPLAPIRYSCVYWINHLLEMETSRQYGISSEECEDDLRSGDSGFRDPNHIFKVKGAIYRFLEKKYLHWLEALSLLSEIPQGIRAMSRLESHLVRHVKKF